MNPRSLRRGYGCAAELERALDRLDCSNVEASTDACSSLIRSCNSLSSAHRIHGHIARTGRSGHTFLGNLLVQMYSRCGSLELARSTFESLPSKNKFSVSIMIAAYAQRSQPSEIVTLFQQMPSWGISPDEFVVASVLKACASLGDGDLGESIHSQIQGTPIGRDAVVQTTLVDMYVKCGRLEEARTVLDEMENKDVVSWTAMISGYAQRGDPIQAIRLFQAMDLEGLKADGFTYTSVIAACSNLGNAKQGQMLHRRVESIGLMNSDVAVQNSLVNMYAKCGCVGESKAVFDRMERRNVCSWTSMLAAFAQNGHFHEAFCVFRGMDLEGLEPDWVTFVTLLGACWTLEQGRAIHERVTRCGIRHRDVDAALVSMYAGFGEVANAFTAFKSAPTRSVVCWTSMIAAMAESGEKAKSVALLVEMDADGVEASEVTIAVVLSNCDLGLAAVREIHGGIPPRLATSIVGTSLVDAYGKCGSLGDARDVFENWVGCKVDAAFWNAMISAYVQKGGNDAAIAVYRLMNQEGIAPDAFTFSTVFGAVTDLPLGRSLQRQVGWAGLAGNVVVQNAVVTMLARCGGINDARAAFDRMEGRDVASWTTLIGGYAQIGQSDCALEMYRAMDVEPNVVTYANALRACSSVGDVDEAKRIASKYFKSGLHSQVVDTTLVDMYAKFGFVSDARSVFQASIACRDTVSWNVMISACAQHGDEGESLGLYHRMNLEGVEASDVTFVSLLIACSRAGKLIESCWYFEIMLADHGILPIAEHYMCVVDILARAGRLWEAEQVIGSMKVPPDGSTWRTLLSACRLHQDNELAVRASDGAFEVNQRDSAAMVLLSNIYSN